MTRRDWIRCLSQPYQYRDDNIGAAEQLADRHMMLAQSALAWDTTLDMCNEADANDALASMLRRHDAID